MSFSLNNGMEHGLEDTSSCVFVDYPMGIWELMDPYAMGCNNMLTMNMFTVHGSLKCLIGTLGLLSTGSSSLVHIKWREIIG